MTDQKITQLSAATTMADTDIFPIVVSPGGSPATDKITKLAMLCGNSIFQPDQQITTADFPNSTTLYGWNMDATTADAPSALYGAGGGGTKFGAKDLTVTGAALGAATDVLGNSKYCSFGGSAYLVSTDAAFNFTTSFSIGCWLYLAAWTTASRQVIISRHGANNGWLLEVGQVGGTIDFTSYSGSSTTSSIIVGCGQLSAGWHHIVLVRDSGNTKTYIYIDGNLAGISAVAGTITAEGNLQLGAYNGATLPLTGYLDEVFIHNATVLTSDQVRAIYSRSAKKFGVKDQNSNIFVPTPNVSDGVYIPTLTNTANIGASTAYSMSWSRVNNTVTCMFKAAITPTVAAPTLTVLTFTIPIACTSTPTGGGVAGQNPGTAIVAQTGAIAPANATTFTYTFSAQNTGNVSHYGIFQYIIN